MVFFVLTAALSGTFSNLLIPLLGARDMASGFMNEHDFILVVFHLKCNYDWFTFVEAGPASSGWTIPSEFCRKLFQVLVWE
jgi:cytochrome c oxidase subunit 1